MKGKNLLIPLVGFIAPPNVYEGNLLNPMIQNVQKELTLHIDIVVADMGYISSDHKRELRKQSQTAVITRVRENMLPPKEYVDHGCPECPEGIPLSWEPVAKKAVAKKPVAKKAAPKKAAAKKPAAKKAPAPAKPAVASAPSTAAAPGLRSSLNPAAAWPFPTGSRPS